ncbi:DUF7545 family protein [Halosimplex salinum]|uniref:DUF7545 family protein n=1 Tax=Halosimplex salinum TaxID=1710538 RepID=UPI000F4706BD|nr:hypothetical protein [Halosimplex salinum]
MAEAETVTLTLESEDGATDELEVPTELLDMLAEGEETAPEVVGDIAMFGFAQRIHSATHHGEGEPDERLAETEERTLDLFEERFGRTFAELTGHSH